MQLLSSVKKPIDSSIIPKNHQVFKFRMNSFLLALGLYAFVFAGSFTNKLHAADTGDFLDPPTSYKPKPLWFWNNTKVDSEGVAKQIRFAHDRDGYGGFGILPFGENFSPDYLSEEYFSVYQTAIEQAESLGMTLYIYDEYGFPSGSAGAIHGDGIPRFANAHPESTIKRLDKHEEDVTGPQIYQQKLPAGKLMACVAMNLETRERIDLTQAALEVDAVQWEVPEGRWKIMSFVCVKDGDPNVDYLDYDSCRQFVEMTHQQYYDRFKEHFGRDKTINGTFYDEPTLYRAKGRIWTNAFNEKFEAKFGFSPTIFYPALWYDIGPETEAARYHLFAMRAELYASGFGKSIQDWGREHGDIPVTGHQDQEEIVNPSNVSGDLMKCFKYVDIPGIDKIGGGRPTERFYKVVSSSAYNYDKAFVMSETFGAMGNISWDEIMHISMEQYTKGVNMLIPHAVWYNIDHVTFLPELSWRSPIYKERLPEYNQFMGRLNLLLQNEGRHIADIAVLYPIATLHAGNYLDGDLGYYDGGVAIPEADYDAVGTILSDEICRDFTFVHPEVLDEKCEVDGDILRMNNELNPEEFRVFIMPGHQTIHWSNLQKIKAYYDAGGKVIATRMLPSKSAEFGHDEDVARTIAEMFPNISRPPVVTASSTWEAGEYVPQNAIDGSMDTRWNSADAATTDQWLEIDFHSPRAVSRTVVREAFNRIDSYEIQYEKDGEWRTCAKGSSIGKDREDSFDEVRTSKLRLFIHSVTSDSPSIAEFKVYSPEGEDLLAGGAKAASSNANGGQSWFLPIATRENLHAVLDQARELYDVEFDKGAELRYIHKVWENQHIYYFANLEDSSVETTVSLRGRHNPELWDPHTGQVVKNPSFEVVKKAGHEVTRLTLKLPSNRSIFVLGEKSDETAK